MSQAEAQYRCLSCGQLFSGRQLVTNGWGDRCCPACKTPGVERHRTRLSTLYALLLPFELF